MTKKVLVVCQHFWPESFRINDICNYLHDKGCEIDVLCGIPNYPKGQFYEGYSYFKQRTQTHDGIHIRRAFEVPRGNNSNFRIFINYISFPIASLFHIPRLLTKKYDKILIYQLSPVLMAIAGILVGKLKKTETTMYVLDLWPENLFSVLRVKHTFWKKLAYDVSHWHYRHVDKLVVLSETMKQRVMTVTHVAEDRIIVLPQACEKIYEEEIHDNDLEKRFAGGFNIVFAGNISPAQSFDTIIGAAKKLKQAGLKNVRWIIVGDGMSRKSLEDSLNQAGLAEVFHFEGHKPIEGIPAYTAIADVLVGCLVKSELLEATIPAKVMSYLAAGRPIVLAMDGEVQKLINETIGCGFAGSTEDSQALADNIRKVQRLTQKERLELGNRGKRYHLKYFERNIILGKLHDFIFS